MQSKSWIELFQRIPETYRDGFGIITSGGTPINLESILRLEEEFMVFRGRLQGTTEAQRTFFLPYAQINVLVYQRLMKEEEVQTWFGDAPVPVVSAATDDSAQEKPAEPAPVPASVQRMDSAPLPGKTNILERLRSKKGSTSSHGTTRKPSE